MEIDLGKNKELPELFDWKIYLIMNPDLIKCGIITEEAAVNHYLSYGTNEYRQYYENHKINNFIYCGGKCASETLYKTFLINKRRTYKLHSYNEQRFINNYKHPINFIESNSKQNETMYIIDCYRNPIERKLSSFFYNTVNFCDFSMEDATTDFNNNYIVNGFTLIIHFKHEKKNYLIKLLEKFSEGLIVDEEHNNYLQLTFKKIESMKFFCKIMDKHKEYFGVLYYKKKFINIKDYYHSIDELFRHYNISESFTRFDFEKKCGIYQHENIVFIKLRFCDIDNWSQILQNIFGMKFNMIADNLSIQKTYHEKYVEFKKNYKVPKSFIKELLKDEHFNAYNTVEEKRQYLKYWMDRSV